MPLKPEDWPEIEQSERYQGYDEDTQRLTRSKFLGDVIWHDPEFRKKYPTVEEKTRFEVKFVGPQIDPAGQAFVAGPEPNWIERAREAWRTSRQNMVTDWMGEETTRTVLSSPGGRNPEAREQFKKAKAKFEQEVKDDPYKARNTFETLFHGVIGLISGIEAAGEKGGVPGAIAGAATAAVGGQLGPQIATPEEIVTVPALAGLGYAVGSSVAWVNQGTGEAYGMLIDADVDDPLASVVARAVGIPYGLIELAQMNRFLPKGTTKTIKQSILRTVLQIAKRRGFGTAVQIGQEGAQRAVVDLAVEGSKAAENLLAGKSHEYKGPKELFNRALEEMKAAAGPMLILNMPGGIAETAMRHPEAIGEAVAAGKAELARVAREEAGEVRIGPGEEAAPDSFEAFEKEYIETWKQSNKYTPEQVGFKDLTDRLSEMSDAHPEWAEAIENRPEGKPPFKAGSQQLQDELNYRNVRNAALRKEGLAAPPAEVKIEKLAAGEYGLGGVSISRKEGTVSDWTVSGRLKNGEFYRETVEGFENAKEVARSVLPEIAEPEPARLAKGPPPEAAIREAPPTKAPAKVRRPPTPERILGIRRKKAEAAEFAALKREKRKEVKVAKEAFVAGKKVAKEAAEFKALEVGEKRAEEKVTAWVQRETLSEEGRARLQKVRAEATIERERIRQAARAKTSTVEGIKKQLVSYAQERLSPEMRGRLLARVAKTKTRQSLARAVDLIEKMHAKEESTEARTSLVKTIKKLDTKHMRGEYRRKVEAIINKLDPTKPTEATLTELEGTRKFLQENPDTWLPDYVVERLERLERTPIADLTTENVREIEAAIKHSVKLEKLKGKLIAAKRSRDLQKTADEIIETSARKRPVAEGVETAVVGELKATGTLKKFWDMMERLETLNFLIDGKEDGASADVFYDSIDRAETERIRIREADKEAIRKKLAQEGVDLEDDFFDWSEVLPKKTEYITITLPSTGKTVTLSKGHRMSFFLTSQRPQGLRHLLEGGRWYLETMETKPWKTTPNTQALEALTLEDVEAINNSMTDQEKAVAKVFNWYMNEYIKPKVNEVSNKIVGFDLLTEEAYWPLTVHPFGIRRKAELPAVKRGYLHETIEGQGIFKPTVPGAKAPIIIRDAFKVLGEHMAKTASYRAYAPALRDAKMVLNMDTVQEAIAFNLGTNTLRNLREFVTRVEDNSYRTGALDSWLNRVLSRSARAILTFKPVVWLRQALSYPVAYTELDAKYLNKQLLIPVFSKKQKTAMLSWMKAHSPQLWYRMQSGKITRDIGDMMASSELADVFADYTGIEGKLAFGLRSGDSWAIMRIVRAAQMQARAKLGAKAKQSEVDAYAAKLAEKCVRNTQPTWHVKDRSVLAGDPRPWVRTITMFRSFREKLVQAQRVAWRRYVASPRDAKAKSKIVRDLTLIMIIAPLLNNLTSELWRRLRGKKPRYKLDKPLQAAGGIFLDLFASNLGHYYVLGDIAENMVKGAGPYKGYEPFKSPVHETAARIVTSGTAVATAIGNAPVRPGADEKKFERAIRTIYRNVPVVVGRGFGIPIEGVVNVGEIVAEIAIPKKKKRKKRRRKKLKGF